MPHHGNTFISFGGDLPTKTLSQVTFAFPAGTSETDITDLTFTGQNNDIDASLDMTNITQINTIRVYEEVDTTNIKQIKEWEWPTDNDNVNDEVLKVSLIGHGTDIKVTIQSQVDEGGINIPISIAEYVY
jgi:hypothetical protein